MSHHFFIVLIVLQLTGWGCAFMCEKGTLGTGRLNNSVLPTLKCGGRGWKYGFSDIWLTAPELIMQNGYPFECHQTYTKDGYLLTFHRIPNPGKPPVLMFHGMSQSSRDFLLGCKHRAPAYKMYDSGFDVWLLNTRGNTYSRGHRNLSLSDPAYWNFSVDEIIKYDATEMIDYSLNITKKESVIWIGYSLGSAVGLGLTSSIPEYNQKINHLVSLATTAYVGKTYSPLLRLITPFQRQLDSTLTMFNHGEAIPSFLDTLMRNALPFVCYPEARFNIPGVCSLGSFFLFGFNTANVQPQVFSILMGSTPGSLGIKMLTHWFQWINTGNFTQYDYGEKVNIEKYGSPYPPSYNLNLTTTKVINFHADGDWVSVSKDVDTVVKSLPNVISNIRVKSKSWNHVDYVYAKDVDKMIYQEIIDGLHTNALR